MPWLSLHHPGGPRSSKEGATERRTLAAAEWFLENHADHVPWHQGTTLYKTGVDLHMNNKIIPVQIHIDTYINLNLFMNCFIDFSCAAS